MNSTRARLIIALLILVPVLVYWGFSGTPSEHSNNNNSAAMDYFINGVHILQYDKQGNIKQATAASRVEHHPDKQANNLEGPLIQLYRKHDLPVTVTATSAHLSDNQQVLTLLGSVELKDNKISGTASTITTEALTVYPETKHAQTAIDVTLSSGDSIMTATGMKADFNSSTIELLSNVKGQHINGQ